MKKGLTKSYIIEFMDAMEIYTAQQVIDMADDIYDWCMLHADELEIKTLTTTEMKEYIFTSYRNAEIYKQFQQNQGFMFGRFTTGR